MKTVTYSVPNISCMHCVHTIQTELADVKGVQSVKADQAGKTVEIVFEAPASEEMIKALLAEINYRAQLGCELLPKNRRIVLTFVVGTSSKDNDLL